MNGWIELAAAALPWAALICATVPTVLFLRNVGLYRPPSERWPEAVPGPEPVSVLVPARDEEGSIEACVRSVLASRGAGLDAAGLDVVVLDDGSTDRTAEIVRRLAAEDPRVRLATAPPLPPGWIGKQHACWQLSRLARHSVLFFLDADVRLAPHAVARSSGFLRQCGAGLVSGIPRQETGTWLEKLLIPLIHFVLLGFLPLSRMRASGLPAYGAACGQLVVCDRAAYAAAGGHKAIGGSLHDGVQLPRAFRRAGFTTDLFDATGLAVCRMYRDARGVRQGLGKNATEGMATAAGIVPWTLILFLGQVLPLPLFLWGLVTHPDELGLLVPLAATVVSYLPRFQAMQLYEQPLFGALGHPLAVALLLVIQWRALGRKLIGGQATWKGRAYGLEEGGVAAGPDLPAG